MTWSNEPEQRRGADPDAARPSGGINPFSGPEPGAGGLEAPAPPRPDRSAATRPARRGYGPTAGSLGGAPTTDFAQPNGYGPPGGPSNAESWGGRRDPAALISRNQRVTEPPAGLGPSPYPPPPHLPSSYPPPILPPRAGHGPPPRLWQGAGRRRWVAVAVVLVAVGALAVTGTVLVAQRFGARLDGLAVKARDLSYLVPADWKLTPGGPETSVDGVALDGVATAARYVCGGHGRYRATVGSTFLVRRDGVDARADDAVRDFGPLFAASFYGADATTNATAPAPLTVGSVAGSTSLVTVHPAASAGCPDLAGALTVVALPTTRKGAAGGTGVLLLVVQHDATGGPPTPAPIADAAVTEILSSVRVIDH
ncbi:MAG TPA: hypothetical protein VH008_12075 [Pseudonocardia sp.]|nr:hypothetical protein [Pseudonocardia sp.]